MRAIVAPRTPSPAPMALEGFRVRAETSVITDPSPSSEHRQAGGDDAGARLDGPQSGRQRGASRRLITPRYRNETNPRSNRYIELYYGSRHKSHRGFASARQVGVSGGNGGRFRSVL